MNESGHPTDLTEPQWELLQPLLPKGNGGGRPPADLRRILNGVLYLTRAGCAWRLLPHDFGPWQTVYGYFRRWKRTHQWEILHDTLRGYVRVEAGKRTQPTAAILDSQTVRSADHAGPRGYDAAKKITGRKRHLLVDTLGLLLWVCVTPADVAERAGARLLLGPALRWFGWLRCLWADRVMTARSWPHGWRPTAKPAPSVWRWCRGSKTSAALWCWPTGGSWNARSAGS